MEAETPVLLHSWQPNRANLVLLRDLLLIRTVKEVQVNRATERTPGHIGWQHKRLHWVSTPLVHAMAHTLVSLVRGRILRRDERMLASLLVNLVVPGVKVERMVAIDVAIDWVTSIGREESSGKVVPQAQVMDALAHTIEIVVLRQLGDELDELVLVYQHGATSVEEHISGRLADDGKAECWLVAPTELKIDVLRVVVWHSLLRQSNEVWREDVVARVTAVDVCRVDVDAQAVRGLHVDCEVQGLDVGAVDVALRTVSCLVALQVAEGCLTGSPARFRVAVKPLAVFSTPLALYPGQTA